MLTAATALGLVDERERTLLKGKECSDRCSGPLLPVPSPSVSSFTFCPCWLLYLCAASDRRVKEIKPKYLCSLAFQAGHSEEGFNWLLTRLKRRPYTRYPVVALKVLVIIHTVIQQIPFETSKARAFSPLLSAIGRHWGAVARAHIRDIVASRRGSGSSSRGSVSVGISSSSAGTPLPVLIARYADVLGRKLAVLSVWELFFQGNWALDPFLRLNGLTLEMAASLEDPAVSPVNTKVADSLLRFADVLSPLALLFASPLQRSAPSWPLSLSALLRFLPEASALLSVVTHLVALLVLRAYEKDDTGRARVDVAREVYGLRERFLSFVASMRDLAGTCRQAARERGERRLLEFIGTPPEVENDIFADLPAHIAREARRQSLSGPAKSKSEDAVQPESTDMPRPQKVSAETEGDGLSDLLAGDHTANASHQENVRRQEGGSTDENPPASHPCPLSPSLVTDSPFVSPDPGGREGRNEKAVRQMGDEAAAATSGADGDDAESVRVAPESEHPAPSLSLSPSSRFPGTVKSAGLATAEGKERGAKVSLEFLGSGCSAASEVPKIAEPPPSPPRRRGGKSNSNKSPSMAGSDGASPKGAPPSAASCGGASQSQSQAGSSHRYPSQHNLSQGGGGDSRASMHRRTSEMLENLRDRRSKEAVRETMRERTSRIAAVLRNRRLSQQPPPQVADACAALSTCLPMPKEASPTSMVSVFEAEGQEDRSPDAPPRDREDDMEREREGGAASSGMHDERDFTEGGGEGRGAPSPVSSDPECESDQEGEEGSESRGPGPLPRWAGESGHHGGMPGPSSSASASVVDEHPDRSGAGRESQSLSEALPPRLPMEERGPQVPSPSPSSPSSSAASEGASFSSSSSSASEKQQKPPGSSKGQRAQGGSQKGNVKSEKGFGDFDFPFDFSASSWDWWASDGGQKSASPSAAQKHQPTAALQAQQQRAPMQQATQALQQNVAGQPPSQPVSAAGAHWWSGAPVTSGAPGVAGPGMRPHPFQPQVTQQRQVSADPYRHGQQQQRLSPSPQGTLPAPPSQPGGTSAAAGWKEFAFAFPLPPPSSSQKAPLPVCAPPSGAVSRASHSPTPGSQDTPPHSHQRVWKAGDRDQKGVPAAPNMQQHTHTRLPGPPSGGQHIHPHQPTQGVPAHYPGASDQRREIHRGRSSPSGRPTTSPAAQPSGHGANPFGLPRPNSPSPGSPLPMPGAGGGGGGRSSRPPLPVAPAQAANYRKQHAGASPVSGSVTMGPESGIAHDVLRLPPGLEVPPDEIRLGALIGSGATSNVYKGMWRGTDVAVKVLTGGSSSGVKGHGGPAGVTEDFARELGVMKELRHPNLVLLMGASTKVQPLALVTEFCAGGSLFGLLHKRAERGRGGAPSSNPNAVTFESASPWLTWRQKTKILHDVAKGLNFLHLHRPPIVHRDLKSLNVLLADRVTNPRDVPVCKVGDFGLARLQDGDWERMELTGGAGTFHWMAPEVMKARRDGGGPAIDSSEGTGGYSEKCDVYSFAIVAYEVLSGRIPFEELGPSPVAVALAVAAGRRPNLALVPPDCPGVLLRLMQASWAQDPGARPSFAQILETLNQAGSF
uniref:Protein kinase domain-containing protein n=1 Tax=Chromera velia CCMP2878 TaxID=1169474 RepID=A0A0G4GRY5_9ALVE|eukprot:Cvel_23045.t1-p1 / transcript=Cvel_23045.t1 / gene=Cvel_23045 / organism=Chromera_velia_CCMP2878 / gene_product=Serine/threonine-protein kinase CTR1, putative / transcript_product=Serine/threonine-protein kinase CTR1, putative / location=Cvel_scaffold2330:21360-29532(+) / protein_length=1581 / sequence_SO=supercontig / SO=protein_coding / is_pseudo=false